MMHPCQPLASPLNCITDVMFCGARPADAGASDLGPRPARQPTRLLLQAYGNHQRVGAPEAPPTA